MTKSEIANPKDRDEGRRETHDQPKRGDRSKENREDVEYERRERSPYRGRERDHRSRNYDVGDRRKTDERNRTNEGELKRRHSDDISHKEDKEYEKARGDGRIRDDTKKKSGTEDRRRSYEYQKRRSLLR